MLCRYKIEYGSYTCGTISVFTNVSIDLTISFYIYMQKSTYCSGDCNVNLREFGHKCQRAVLDSLMYHEVNNGGDIDECTWLEHLIREQNLQGKHSHLAQGPFKHCKK